jgi:ABC-type molybdate transport system substrate-binding protein
VSRRGIAALLVVMGAVLAPPDAPAGDTAKTRLYAAGSLKPALTELIEAFSSAHDVAVEATFGASGLLRARLEADTAGGVFASADLDNPRDRAGPQGRAGGALRAQPVRAGAVSARPVYGRRRNRDSIAP